MNNGSEKRHFSRINFEARAELPDGDSWQIARLLDISLKGALIAEPEGWSADLDSLMTIRLFLHSETSEDPDLKIKARLAHREGGHAGFCWEEIELDDFTELRRLLELNLGSEELLLRELTALIQAD